MYATLREKGHLNVGYVEDSYLQGGMIRECQCNVADTCCLYTRLGIAIHSMKSVLGPVESLGFPGFCSDFCQYNSLLPTGNVSGIKELCLRLISSVSISVEKQTPFRTTMVVSKYRES